MTTTLGQTLADHFISVREDWTHRLRQEPPLSALGRSETVGFLVDATLLQLQAGLAQSDTTGWLRRCPPLVGPVHAYCACALAPTRRYFEAGEDALREVLTPIIGPAIDVLVTRLQELAAQEERSLCQPCPRMGSPVCLLGTAGDSRPGA